MIDGAGVELAETLRALAQAELEHAATCPYCRIDREVALWRELQERVQAKPEPATAAAA